MAIKPASPKMHQIAVPIPWDLGQKLSKYLQRTGLKKQFVVKMAIEKFLQLEAAPK